MKRFKLIIILVLIVQTNYAQIDDWASADLRLGYRFSSNSVYSVLMDGTRENPTYAVGNFNFGTTHLSLVSYSRFSYIEADFSLAGNLIQAELMNTNKTVLTNKGEEIIYPEHSQPLLGASYQHMSLKFGFGTYISEVFGIFGGAQWKWNTIQFATVGTEHAFIKTDKYLARPGGGMLGVNVNLMAAYLLFLLNLVVSLTT
jgi:hypothetical protein